MVLGEGDQLDRHLGGALARTAQGGPHIGAVELDAAHRVASQGGLRVVGAWGDALQVAQHPGPGAGQAEPPDAGGEEGQVEGGDVPGVDALGEELPQVARGGAAQALAQPEAHVVEAGPGHRGVGGEAAFGAGGGDGLPGLQRAPVVGDDVHRAVGADGVGDGEQVRGELLQAVAGAVGGDAGGAGAAHVVADHVVVAGEVGGDVVPDRVGVGVAVDQQHGGCGRVALFEDREREAAGPDGAGAGGAGGTGAHRAAPSGAAVAAATPASASAQRRTCGRSSSSQ